NRGFTDQLRRARDTALTFSRRASDAEGHMRALALFSAVLADGHASVHASYSGHGDILWPGFRTVWRGDALRVIDSVGGRPPSKSKLLSCDGKDARTVIREQSSLGLFGRPAEAGQWWEFAPDTLEHLKSSYQPLPRQCRFRGPDGRVITLGLGWRPEPEAVFQNWFKTASRREPVGLSEARPGIYLITLSTFSPDEEGRAQYDQLFSELEHRIATIEAAKAVVIDLRRNSGGSSSWGEDVAGKLWGRAAVKAKLADYFRHTQVWWLADAQN